MSYVREVLDALGVVVAREERSRVWALCPYHQKPTDPKSWATTFFVRLAGKRRDADGNVYEAEGQFHCFSCGEGGSLRRLVMFVKDVDEEKAKAFIRKRGGKTGSKVEELRRVVTVVRRERPVRRRYRLPSEVILEPLREWVGPARDYAIGRGITEEEVETFGLGYAVDGVKLAGRIVFPCRGADGAPAHYSARTFIDEEPRYTTPGPDEPGADRSVLFGEHLWPVLERRSLILAVTEGSANSLAVRRALRKLRPDACYGALGGAKNFDAEHAKKIASFGLVLVLTDPDAAGDAAAVALEAMTGRYTRLKRIRLPVRNGRKLDAQDVGTEYLEKRLGRALGSLSC